MPELLWAGLHYRREVSWAAIYAASAAPGEVVVAKARCIQVSAPGAHPEAELASMVGGQDDLQSMSQQQQQQQQQQQLFATG
jgi:hypothetical protein